jgi:hypothetical protein
LVSFRQQAPADLGFAYTARRWAEEAALAKAVESGRVCQHLAGLPPIAEEATISQAGATEQPALIRAHRRCGGGNKPVPAPAVFAVLHDGRKFAVRRGVVLLGNW